MSATPSTPFVPARADDPDGVGYVVLEQARLQCERELETISPCDGTLAMLRGVRRQLGLAGYRISERLDADLRAELLELARAGLPHVAPGRSGIERIYVLALHGRLVAADVAQWAWHGWRAHNHCRTALRTLRGLVGEERAIELAAGAEGRGELDLRWQRRQLADALGWAAAREAA